jgi:polyketide cyclase/dehydrase/lipid transport protein
MGRVTARAQVVLTLESTVSLWTDPARWATFVEGFAAVVELDEEWPAEGARVVWQSIPAGRGRVTEKVLERSDRRIRTQLFEEALAGEHVAVFTPTPDGTLVELELDYRLSDDGPLRALADVLFIRRSLRDSLRRTLERFAVEAEEEAGLR